MNNKHLQQPLRQLADGWHAFWLEFNRVFGRQQAAIHHARCLIALRSPDDVQDFLAAYILLAGLLARGTQTQMSECRSLLGDIRTLIGENAQVQNVGNEAILIMIGGVLEERVGAVVEAEQLYRESHSLFRKSPADIGLDHACALELLSSVCARQGKERRAKWASRKAKAIRSKHASRMMLAYGPIY